MIFDLVYILVFFVLLCIGLIVLSVLYRRYCSESAYYQVVSDNSTKTSRSPLCSNAESPGIGSAPSIDLNEVNDKESPQSKEKFENEKPREELPRESKAVENDYVVPSELKMASTNSEQLGLGH